jgi:hypothetical protein
VSKRKPTIKSLRVGQTIWYAHFVFGLRVSGYEARKVAILSDRTEVAPAYIIPNGYPRWFIRESMAAGRGPEFVSHSRRKVLAWITANSRGRI